MQTRSLNSNASVDAGLVILRVTTGIIAAAHGGQKLFIYGIDGVSGAFAQMGIPMAGIAGPMTGVVELIGGLALIVGLFTRFAGVAIAATMLGAIGFVHLAAGFFAPAGIEFPLALLGASSTLAVIGAGRYSLDAVLSHRLAGSARNITPLNPIARAS